MFSIRRCALCLALLLLASASKAAEPGGKPAGSRKAVPAKAEETGPSKKEAPLLDRILSEMDQAYRGLRSYRAEFEQESELKTFDRKTLASGKVYFLKPNKMRWSYVQPAPREVYLSGEQIEIYLPDLNQVILQTLNDAVPGLASARLFMGVEELVTSFSVSLDSSDTSVENAYCLRLTPKKDEPLSVEEILLWVGRKDFLPLRTESQDVLGNLTILSFRNAEVNVSLPEDLFHLKIPPNAEVIRNSL